MPSTRKRSSSTQSDERSVSPPPAKRRSRTAYSPLPDNPFSFRKEPSGTIQIATWNVAGLATCNSKKWDHGLRLYVEAENATILAITEVNDPHAEATFEEHADFAFLRAMYPYRYWANKVAVVSKIAPISEPVFGFPEGKRYDKEDGRVRALTLEFRHCYLLATYVPNSGENFKKLERRKDWTDDFEPYIRSLDAKKPVIWTGDFNVIRMKTPTSTATNDLQWDVNLNKVAGTSKFERDAHERLLGEQEWLENPRRPGPRFVDVWRLIKGPDWRQYTHSSKKLGGWRIDGFITSERFLHHIRKCEIRQEVKRKFWPEKDVQGRGACSDHWPVWLSLEMEEL
ncbi:hypothetical protein JCM8547_005812 [Rhodosporidiobolus lusitaniae]